MTDHPSIVALPTTQALIAAALAEDVGGGDWTTVATVPAGREIVARLVVKQAGVVCGGGVAAAVFRAYASELRCTCECEDGARVVPGTVVLSVRGNARAILTAERTALNFVQRLSGIATSTAAFVAALRGTSTRLRDTRKTTPGWRALEKYAVRCGGGENHRMRLDDAYLIKSTHVDLAGGVRAALVAVAAQRRAELPLEIEVRDLNELDEALQSDVSLLLLDNFSLDDLRAAVARVPAHVRLEASGGIGLHNVAAVAATGVHYVAIGAVTHSAPALDIHLEIVS